MAYGKDPIAPKSRGYGKDKEEGDTAEPTFGERAKSLAYGATTGFLGGIGELEKLGQKATEFVVPRQPGEGKPLLTGGRETFFPTTQEVEKGLAKVGIKKPREEVSGYRTAGEIIGSVGPALPGIARGGVKALIGQGTALKEKLALKAEQMGFKLSPAQVRRVEPVSAKGAKSVVKDTTTSNQNLANRLSSQGTGAVAGADGVSKEFLKGRFGDLGSKFDAIYKGKEFKVDQEAIDAIRELSAMESSAVGGLGVSPVRRAAGDIVSTFDSLIAQGGAADSFRIQGEGLQKLRNALSEAARSTSSRGNAHEIYDLIDRIDASVARNHPEVAEALKVLRPQYRNTVVLEDLYRQGGIDGGDVSLERLGTMLRGKPGAVRLPGGDIDELAELGRELKMRALWERSGHVPTEGESALASVLGTSSDVLGTGLGLRGQSARALQRFYSGAKEPGLFSRAPVAGAAGQAARQLSSEEE
jgi:hypothetical protein